MTTKDLQAAPASLHDLIGQVAAEVATPLTRALERVRALQAGEPADAELLRALHDEVAHARHIGILGQQIARLASGTVRQVLEPVDLQAMLRELLDEQRHDAAMKAAVRERLAPVTVVADSGLAGALLRSVIDWCTARAGAPVDLVLEARPNTSQAVLTCRFSRRIDDVDADEPLSWHLMQFAAVPLGARLDVDDTGDRLALSVALDRLAAPATAGEASAADLRLLAGCQLLVVSNDRDIRHQVRRAVQRLDLLVDYVTSVDAALDYCAEGLPQAIVYASSLAGVSMNRLRSQMGDMGSGPSFIEICPDRDDYEPATAGERGVRRVAIDELAQALPAALVAEITRRR